MNSRRAILLFVRDEQEELLLKPLPRLDGRAIDYRQILQSVVRRIRRALTHADLILCSTGSTSCVDAQIHLLQKGDSFGERITRGIEETFALGYDQVVVIGNDCPELKSDDIVAAFGRLEEGWTIAAAPTVDGGSFLIGVAKSGGDGPLFDRSAFCELPWQTDQLFHKLVDLPGAVPLPILRTDCDNWNRIESLLLLRLYIVALRPFRIAGERIHRTFIDSRLRKSLTRFFLSAPPFSPVLLRINSVEQVSSLHS